MHKWSNAGLLVTILSTYLKRSPVSLPAVYYGGRLRGVMRRGNANLFSASLRHWKCCPPHHQWGWCTPFSMRFLSPYCPPFPLPWAHWPEASLMSFLPMSPPVLEPLKFMLPGLSSLAGFSNPIILSTEPSSDSLGVGLSQICFFGWSLTPELPITGCTGLGRNARVSCLAGLD